MPARIHWLAWATMRVGKKIQIGAEIDIAGIIKGHFDYVKERTTIAIEKGDAEAATAGEYGAATSRGSSASGENGLSVARGNEVKVKGGLGAILVIAEEKNDSYDIVAWGEKIKADTWYQLDEIGEFVEAE